MFHTLQLICHENWEGLPPSLRLSRSISYQLNIGHQTNKIRTATVHLGNIFPTLLGILFSLFDVSYVLFAVIHIYSRVLWILSNMWPTGFLQERDGGMRFVKKNDLIDGHKFQAIQLGNYPFGHCHLWQSTIDSTLD